jgi:hypothetical protein
MAIRKAISLPNHEIVTLAVYLLGGEEGLKCLIISSTFLGMFTSF